ncbi:uncharacterized protein L3040_003048 [Drepanopeziza brunnea f. sp. 'multigermtubi']|uniref:uncharacterized protein n=1 Tax=Drepanopeziza brunnea f. sp. 'multigermtubi' TaxID=698441 RepID=UPI00239C4A71|nr:hypothetical protein L3040_003048 [Drepanopeziza brunnea f. sp. 'multigermtubi']
MAERAAQIASHLNYPKGMLAGQVAIITGSGQGIGAEAARLFANEGAKVIVSDIDGTKARQVADNINKSGGKALAIHIIVNNAGYTWDGVIHKMTDKQWENIIALHNTAPFKLVREAAPYFRVTNGEPRCIINISSTSGVHGIAGQANYGVAKSGINGLTKEDGAFVTTPDGEKIALGIPKGQGSQQANANLDIPLRRPGSATEAASSILAVASPLFSYITGQVLMVTGGRNM